MKHRIHEGALYIAVPGDVLSTGVEELKAGLFELIGAESGSLSKGSPEPKGNGVDSKWKNLELDLSKAAMIDSMGLNLLVSVFKRVAQRGGKMRITVHDKNVERLLRFTRLDEHVEVIHG